MKARPRRARWRPQDTSAEGQPPLTRRQVLKGAVGAGAVALVVPTVRWGQAPHQATPSLVAAPGSAATIQSAALWFYRSVGQTIELGAINPDATTAASGLTMPLACQFASNGLYLACASIQHPGTAEANHVLTILDLSTGQSTEASGLPFNDDGVSCHALTVRISSDSTTLAILDSAWTITPGAPLSRSIFGATTTLPSLGFQSLHTVEVFLASTVASLGLVALEDLVDNIVAVDLAFLGSDPLVLIGQPGGMLQQYLLNSSPTVQTSASNQIGGLMPQHASSVSLASGSFVRALGMNGAEIVNSDLTTTQLRPLTGTSAKPSPASVLAIDAETALLVNPGLPSAATLNTTTAAVQSSAVLSNFPPLMATPLRRWVAACSSTTLYVADMNGGIWVYNLPTLQLADRWLSSTPFAAVVVPPAGAAIFAITPSMAAQPLAMSLSPSGAVIATAELPFAPTGLP